MKVIAIGTSDSPTVTIAISDLEDRDGNDAELSICNPDDLVFDKRPIYYDAQGYTFDIEIEGEEIALTRTDKNDHNTSWDC